MGTPAAAEYLEEAALSQGGEGSSSDSRDAGEGLSASIHRTQQVADKKQEVIKQWSSKFGMCPHENNVQLGHTVKETTSINRI